MDPEDQGQTIQPQGGPAFAVPSWLQNLQQAQPIPEAPSPAPTPSAIPGIPGIAPEVAAHIIGQPPQSPVSTPVPKPQKPLAPVAQAQADEKAAQGQLSSDVASEGQAIQGMGTEKAAAADEAYQQQEKAFGDVYGQVNPKTGQREGGLVAQNAVKAASAATKTEQVRQKAAQAHEAWANAKVSGGLWAGKSTGQKVLGAIGIALSGIGMAMAHKPGENPALKMLEDQAREDAQIALSNRTHLGEVASAADREVADYRQQGMDDQAAGNMLVASRLRQMGDMMTLAAAKHGSPMAKQQALIDAAQLKQKSDALLMQATQRTTDQQIGLQEHKESLGMQGAQMAQAAKFHDADQKEHIREFDSEMNEKAAQLEAADNKADAAALKAHAQEVEERGLMVPTGAIDPRTGLRGQAYLKKADGTFWTTTKEQAPKVQEALGGAKTAISAIDELRQLVKDNGGIDKLNRWSPAALEKAQALERALVGMHKASGIVGFRGNVMDVMEKQLTGGAKPGDILKGLMPQLEAARRNAIEDFQNSLPNYDGADLGEKNFPDPLKMKSGESEGEQITQPFNPAPTSGVEQSFSAPTQSFAQTNEPSVLGNFGAPTGTTLPQQAESLTSAAHEFAKKKHK